MITTLEARCGGTRRVVCFDRGMATEANLRLWRQTQRPYLGAPRRAITRHYLAAIREGPWQTVRGQPEADIAVQPLADHVLDGVRERWLLCRSAGCQLKERQMFETRLTKARERLVWPACRSGGRDLRPCRRDRAESQAGSRSDS